MYQQAKTFCHAGTERFGTSVLCGEELDHTHDEDLSVACVLRGYMELAQSRGADVHEVESYIKEFILPFVTRSFDE